MTAADRLFHPGFNVVLESQANLRVLFVAADFRNIAMSLVLDKLEQFGLKQSTQFELKYCYSSQRK